MKSKKTTKADLKRSRVLFFEIGMIAVIVAVIAVFAASNSEKPVMDLTAYGSVDGSIVETVPFTKQEKPKVETAARNIITDVLIKVPNDRQIITSYSFFDPDSEDIFLPSLEPKDEVITEPELISEKMPSFMGGGLEAFRDWVVARFRYPQAALDSGIEGKVLVEFVIEKDGSLGSINILQTTDPLFGAEAQRVVAMSPQWSPGFNGITPVRIKYFMPIEFKIQKR